MEKKASQFTIECRDKLQIPGHGWVIEAHVKEGIIFPGTDVKLLNVAGERILIGTVMGLIHDDDLADFVMEGQNCGALMRYVDLSDLDVEGLIMQEL